MFCFVSVGSGFFYAWPAQCPTENILYRASLPGPILFVPCQSLSVSSYRAPTDMQPVCERLATERIYFSCSSTVYGPLCGCRLESSLCLHDARSTGPHLVCSAYFTDQWLLQKHNPTCFSLHTHTHTHTKALCHKEVQVEWQFNSFPFCKKLCTHTEPSYLI